jgi:hypothetical protein
MQVGTVTPVPLLTIRYPLSANYYPLSVTSRSPQSRYITAHSPTPVITTKYGSAIQIMRR